MRLELNEQFQKALALMEDSGRHLFVTGKAGTGKSTLLNYFLEQTEKSVAVLAPTGVAALHIGGETIHSFFRFHPHITVDEAKKKGLTQGKNTLYKAIKIVVIDEVSMVRADLMDCVDVFLRMARKSKKPFGGVQMIMIGDLYQLPPVVAGSDDRAFFEREYGSPWFFDSHVFQNPQFTMEFIELEKIYRQSDAGFIQLLNAIRNNTATENQLRQVNAGVGNGVGISAKANDDRIFLTATNARADEINLQKLRALRGEETIFDGMVEGGVAEKQFPTDLTLRLKPKAQVMFVNNDSAGRWVNGTLGRIAKIEDGNVWVDIPNAEIVLVEPYTWDVSRYVYDRAAHSLSQEVTGSFRQIPLQLAWAITIHKSQGKTFDRVAIDLGRGSFASGQTYVALSRCRTFDGIRLEKPLKKSDVRMDWRVRKFLTGFQYALSESSRPLEEKIKLIEKIIARRGRMTMTYLKASDIKSRRVIQPRELGEYQYLGKKFLGVTAWCEMRKEERVFRVDRILEMNVES